MNPVTNTNFRSHNISFPEEDKKPYIPTKLSN